MKNLLSIFIILGIFFFYSCKEEIPIVNSQLDQNYINYALYAKNFSQSGSASPERMVLMHNPMGVRIEYNISNQTLALWISPQAGKYLGYRYRNFSNRDDHTNIFEEITFPQLSESRFISCDYDAFHSILNFEEQKMHIMAFIDKPGVMIWFEEDELIDFKTHAEDRLLERSTSIFACQHENRGFNFHFVASLGNGDGIFLHQPETDYHRSTYARAKLNKNQNLIILGELAHENILNLARQVSDRSMELLTAINEEKINKQINNGIIDLDNFTELENILNVNKKFFLSAQDASGALRSSPKYIFYLLWNRDQAIATSYNAFAGWEKPLTSFSRFLMHNPNISTNVEPKGRFYGQLTGGPLTKWEEDGAYYAALSAFSYWTQTSDRVYANPYYMNVLTESVNWLEQLSFDEEKGLFGRYHFSETPFTASHGEGWDLANGRPTPYTVTTIYKQDTLVKAYDIYINSLCYSMYKMLGSLSVGNEHEIYLNKADKLKENMEVFYNKKKELPYYGDLMTTDSNFIRLPAFGIDTTDYIRALSTPFFSPLPITKQIQIQEEFLNNLFPSGSLTLASMLMFLQNIDPEYISEAKIMNILTQLTPEVAQAKTYLPMENALMERLYVKDGHPFFDIKPVPKSYSTLAATITGLGVRRLPFGLAVRPSIYLKSIEKYNYKGKNIDFLFSGSSPYPLVYINGNQLVYSLQIPENFLTEYDNKVIIQANDKKHKKTPLLISSTLLLEDVKHENNTITYSIQAFGSNELIFKNLQQKQIIIKNQNGQIVDIKVNQFDEYTQITFYGKGYFEVSI